jgi:hypothetical protein
MARVQYRAGDCYAVPLRGGGFAVGVVARAKDPVLFGYFFGPRHSKVPDLTECQRLAPADAILIGPFGHLGIVNGTWPLIGRLDDWDRATWPMPPLIRNEELTGRSFLVWHDDNDPIRVIREDLIPPGQAAAGPRDGLMGHGYVETLLSRILHWDT